MESAMQLPDAVPKPPRTIAGRALGAVDAAATGLLLAAVGVMVGVVATQVGLRYGFNRSIDWADEVSRLAFVWSIFLAVPLGVREGGHIGIELVAEKLPPAARDALRRAMAALACAMMLVIAWYAVVVIREQADELLSTIDISVAWFVVPVAVGALHSALHLARFTIVGAPAPKLEAAE